MSESSAQDAVHEELQEITRCLDKIAMELACLNVTLKACLGVCLAMEQEKGE